MKINSDPATIGDVKSEVGCLACLVTVFLAIALGIIISSIQDHKDRIKTLETQIHERQ